MPPDSDGSDDKYTTTPCRLCTFIPDAYHLSKIQEAVTRVHDATFLTMELLNLQLRVSLQDPAADLACFFQKNWLLKAFNVVTSDPRAKATLDADLVMTRDLYMPSFTPPSRNGVQQCLLYACRNLAAIASTNVWFHFPKRILSHVRRCFALQPEEYEALSKEEKKQRRLHLMQAASDLCRHPDDSRQAPTYLQQWVNTERVRLGIDTAVGGWNDKPLKWHLKVAPHRFVRAMAIMSRDSEQVGGKSFALYPLRRTHIPRHARFDEKALRDLLGFGANEHHKKKKKNSTEEEAWDLPPLQPNPVVDADTGAMLRADDTATTGKRKRRTKDELKDEKGDFFRQIVDFRAAKVRQHSNFDFQFTTDGVTTRILMFDATKKGKTKTKQLQSMPIRGKWSIDELKRVSRLEDVHVVGVDPGKRDLVNCVDMDDPKRFTPIRYTQAQRRNEQGIAVYKTFDTKAKTQAVLDAEASLEGFNSRSADLDTFRSYLAQRRSVTQTLSDGYSDIGFRTRRWKRYMNTQRSEAKLYNRLKAIKKDDRPLVLAYGSWGMIAGRPGAACNKGNPPTIGVGLMRKLAKHFVVSLTPEAYTSKTCCHCLGPCGPWKEVEDKMGKTIRGLRRCQNEECTANGGLPLNRDKNGAINIGTNFRRFFEDKALIRSMTDEDIAFHRATICLACE